jgi:glutaconyl-CoA/methylmalonyl-CoA decarboxylase subunit gamma
MKRKFKITVEGADYEVEVEEIHQGPAPHAAPPPPVAAPARPPVARAEAPAQAAPAAPRPQASRAAGKGVMASPMQGMVFALKVKVGDAVKVGDVLLVLEAMKMESDIPSPQDGVIKEIFVAAGQHVRRGDPLLAIEG